MGGLLQQLRRKKSIHSSSIHDVLIVDPELMSDASAIDLAANMHTTEGSTEDAARLLSELISESQTSLPAADIQDSVSRSISSSGSKNISETALGKKVVRRKSSSTASQRLQRITDAQPWWLGEAKKPLPQVEALLPSARKFLEESLPSDVQQIPGAVRQAVERAAESLSQEIRFSKKELSETEKELLALTTGKGPLEPLFNDSHVTDIFIDSHKSIKAYRRGLAIETPFSFRNTDEYQFFLQCLLRSAGANALKEQSLDLLLDDQWRSRLNVLHPALTGGTEHRVYIRVPRPQQLSFYDVLQAKALPATLAAWLAEAVSSREINILVVGSSSSGKTLLATALVSAVGTDERIVAVEEVPEIHIPTSHVEKLIASPNEADKLNTAALLKIALRRAPHRIVVGDIRGEESKYFLRALETGLTGSIGTLHADSAVDGLWRFLDLVSSYETTPIESIMRRVARSIHLVIAMKRIDGTPCVTEISEVSELREGQFHTVPLIQFQGVIDGKRQWQLMQGQSHWLDRIAARGMILRPGPGLIFNSRLTSRRELEASE